MTISSNHKKYLNRKHIGGINNQKGNRYETIYATGEIVRLLAKHVDPTSTWITSQVRGVFVDDLCILENNGQKCYHQIKDVKNLSWGKDKPCNLLYDFKWQQYYSTIVNENFKLKLVYSNTGCPVHNDSIPEVIRDVTIREYFPAYQTMSEFLQDSSRLRKNLSLIMNYPGNDFPLDMQLGSLELISSQWQELSRPNTPVALSQIIEAYNKKHPLSPNLKTFPDVSLSASAVEILSKFPDLHYSINGSNMYWKFKRMGGLTSVTDLEETLATNAPASAIELITLLA